MRTCVFISGMFVYVYHQAFYRNKGTAIPQHAVASVQGEYRWFNPENLWQPGPVFEVQNHQHPQPELRSGTRIGRLLLQIVRWLATM